MDNIWTVLGIAPTEDISAIKRAYAERAKSCHPEEEPEGFLQLRQAYQTALDYAGGTKEGFSLTEPPEENAPPVLEEDTGWSLREQEDDGPNPYEDGEAITGFMELYTGKQRKNPAMWMNYITSDSFLDAAWDTRFTSLLLRKVREVQEDFPPNRECLTWLNVAYQFSGGEAHSFDGTRDLLQIAALGPAPKQPKGNAFAILQSFLDYRHLNSLADAGRWDQEAMEAFRHILGRYSSAYIRERCEQRVKPDCERHPAGVRVFLHFFRREDLPDALFQEAWQRLDLKSAVMGRAKVLYGPLRELAVRRLPGIGSAPVVNFLQLNRNLDAYLKRIRANPEAEAAESAAFFESSEMQMALPVPRFLEQQLLTFSPWRREGVGEGLIRRMLDYYREHMDIPRAEEVISGLEGDLRICEVKRWNREDDQADPEGIPYYERLTLRYRPLFRWWLNTAFYTAQDPETGMTLLEYLEKYLPYQASWSRRFTRREDGTPRTIAVAMGMVEIDCYPMHLEYRMHGKPVYRPCLTWEQTAQESGDWFALLLPITAASCRRFDEVSQEIHRRLSYLPVPGNDRALIALCLAGHVCCLQPDQETGEAVPQEQLPMELSMEGGGRLYTAVWREDEGPVTIYRQTSFGRRMQERLTPDPDGTWTVAASSWEGTRQPVHGDCAPDIRFTADSGLAAAQRRLPELVSPTYFDLSRLRKLPRHIYYTPVGGAEESLTHIDLLQNKTRQNALSLLEQWEAMESIPPDMEEILSKVRQALEDEPPEEEPIPQEILVTGEALSTLLGRFAVGELDRLEMEWDQGRLVFCHDGDKYACLYFENDYGHGNDWYALLADPEMYRTVDCNEILYIPFGMGKLAEYSIFHTVQDLLQNIDLILGQMGWGQLQSGGPGGWLWSCDVNRHDARHKMFMAQQKLGGVPPLRGQNYCLAKFVLSRFASELETVELNGVRTVTALQSGSYGLAATGLAQFMVGKLERIRLSWTFQTPESGAELRHLVLLQDHGKYMMFWLQDGDRLALAYGADEPRWFMGHALPGCLVHEMPQRLRNGIDLLLDDIDNIEPLLRQPGQFAEVHTPYETLRAELVHEAT